MEQDFQQELLEIFQQEAEDYLAVLRNGIQSLEEQPAPETIEEIFRTTHSLKGAARAVSFSAVEELCQALESIFSKIKNKELKLSSELIETFADAVDALVDLLEQGELDANPDEQLLLKLQEIVSGRIPSPKERPAKVSTPPPEKKLSNVAPSHSPKKHKTTKGETIRIPYSRLQELMHSSEELISVKIKYHYYLRKINELTQMCEQLQQLTEREKSSIKSVLQDLQQQLQDFQKSLSNDAFQIKTHIDSHIDKVRDLMLFPFSTITEFLEHSTRKIAKELGKRIILKIIGAETKFDKHMLEMLKDPLIHMIRNSIDHGIETPTERQYMGKPETGTIKIEVIPPVKQKIKIIISDDGAGFNVEKIKQIILSKGLATAEQLEKLSDHEIIAFIFKSGFSTKSEVSKLSGRGLGMAVVKENIEKLGGSLQIKNNYPNGSTFILNLPLSFASSNGILVQTSSLKLFLPTSAVENTIRIKSEALKSIENKAMLNFEGQNIPVYDLASLLGLNPKSTDYKDTLNIVILQSGDKQMALIIDRILDEREILIKKLSPPLENVSLLSGITTLGDGSLVPIVNISELFYLCGQDGKSFTVQQKEKSKKILIVEDSITSRVLLKNVLETAGFEVELAVDGQMAWDKLKEHKADLIISDIQMPKMDGITLTRKIKSDSKLKDIPLILLTSLDAEEDRKKGLEAGANAYFVKGDFKQNSILEIIKKLI